MGVGSVSNHCDVILFGSDRHSLAKLTCFSTRSGCRRDEVDGFGLGITVSMCTLLKRIGGIAESGKNEFTPDAWKQSPPRGRGRNLALESGPGLVFFCTSSRRGGSNFGDTNRAVAYDQDVP